MQEKILTDVSPGLRELHQKGCATLNQGDAEGAIAIFNQILEQEPGLVECRLVLRRAQLLRAKKHDGFFNRAADEVREFPELAEAETHLRSSPLKALRAAEQALNRVPNSILAHRLFAKAALNAHMPYTALLSLNFIYNHVPENIETTLDLVGALASTGRVREAVSICGRMQKDYPDDARVVKALGFLGKLAFDAHTNEMSRAAARRFFKSRAANLDPMRIESIGRARTSLRVHE